MVSTQMTSMIVHRAAHMQIFINWKKRKDKEKIKKKHINMQREGESIFNTKYGANIERDHYEVE